MNLSCRTLLIRVGCNPTKYYKITHQSTSANQVTSYLVTFSNKESVTSLHCLLGKRNVLYTMRAIDCCFHRGWRSVSICFFSDRCQIVSSQEPNSMWSQNTFPSNSWIKNLFQTSIRVGNCWKSGKTTTKNSGELYSVYVLLSVFYNEWKRQTIKRVVLSSEGVGPTDFFLKIMILKNNILFHSLTFLILFWLFMYEGDSHSKVIVTNQICMFFLLKRVCMQAQLQVHNCIQVTKTFPILICRSCLSFEMIGL